MALCWVTVFSLAVLARQALSSYDPVYPTDASVRYNGSRSSRFPDNDVAVETDLEYFISELNFEAVPGKLITGAADKLYRLNSDLTLDQRYDWSASSNQLADCATVNTGSLQSFTCRNHLRVFTALPSDGGRMMTCGTLAGVEPQCRTVPLDLSSSSSSSVASNGIVSYYPEYPGFGEFREGDSSDTTYFSAGYFSDPSGGTGRSLTISFHSVTYDTASATVATGPSLSLKDDDFWINAPVTFVDYYRGDYDVIFPASLTEEYQFYFVFFRENLVGSNGGLNTVYSRVARICRNDPGINGQFTSYMKARIFCEREVPPGREFTGTADFQYNEIRSVAFNSDGRYYENGAWGRLMYGAFSGASIGPKGTAICVYTAGNGVESNNGFSSGIFDIFREDVQRLDPVTGQTVETQNTFLECNPSGRSVEDAEYIQIVRDVKQIGEDPILVFDGFYVTHMVVDRVCVVRRDEEQCSNQDVMFLGTDDGRILKVVLASLDSNDDSDNIEPVISEEIQLDDNRAINSMKLEADGGTSFLYVTTDSRVYRFPLERCSRHQSCQDCIQARDPYCVWNIASSRCEANTLSASSDVAVAIPANIAQDIHLGSVPECAVLPECVLSCFPLSSSSLQVTATCSNTAQVQFSSSVLEGASAATCSLSPSALPYPPLVSVDSFNTACVQLSGGLGLQVHELNVTAFVTTSSSSVGTLFTCGPITTLPGAPQLPMLGDILTQVTSTSLTVTLAVPVFTDFIDQYSFQVSYTTSDNPSTPQTSASVSFVSSAAPHSVSITGLTPASTAQYSVQLTNSIATVSSQSFTATLPPSLPGPVTLHTPTPTPLTPSTLTLSWDPPSLTNGAITGYVVRVDTQAVVGCSELSATSFTVEGLTPFEDYDVSVAACTDAGEGPVASATVRMPCGVPSAVLNPAFSDVQSTSLTASWEPPLNINGDPAQLMYQVTWTCSYSFGSVTSQTDTMSTSSTSLTTNPSNLLVLPLSTCSATIFARNRCLNQAEINGIPDQFFVRTPLGTPGLVTNLEAVALGSESVLITWDPPVDYPHQTLEYDIRVVQDSNMPLVLGVIQFNETYVNKYVTGLSANTQYTISVAANGGQFNNITQTTLPSVPSPPPSLSLQTNAADNIVASWSDPTAVEFNVSSYRVFWRCNDLANEATTTSTSYEIVIDSSVANFAFCGVQVQSVNTLGQSQLSSMATVAVPPRRPEQPRCFFNDNRGSTISISYDVTYPFSVNGLQVEYCYTSDQGVRRDGTVYYSGENFTSNVLEVGVDRNTRYDFQLRLCNEHGCGEYCDTLSVNTSSISPRPPSLITSSDITHNSALITWTIPEGETESEITYNVQITSSCPKTTNFIANITQRWYTPEDLCAETNYTIAVQVNTVVNGTTLTGMFGPHYEFITLPGEPSAPRNIREVYSQSLQELKVTWGSPQEPNGTLRSYEINWSNSTIGKSCLNLDGLVYSSVISDVDALEFSTTNTGNINTSKTLRVCVRAYTTFPGEWGEFFTAEFEAGALTNPAPISDCNGLIAVAVVAGCAVIAAVFMSVLLAVVICKYGWTPCMMREKDTVSEDEFKDQRPAYEKSQSIQSTSSNTGLVVVGRSNGVNKKRKR